MDSLAIRVALLALLLFALNAWTVRHIGSDIRELATLNGFTAFLAIVMGWIDKQDADHWRQRLQAALRRTTATPVLMSLYVLAIIGTSFVSSVTVLADGANGNTALHLTPEGRQRDTGDPGRHLTGPSGQVRFVRFTNPFGRQFYLEAAGYQRQSLTLKPWAGSTISLSSDLVQLPSVFLRIPTTLHSLLAGSRMVVSSTDWPQAFEIPLHAERAAVQLGPAAAVPEAWKNEWRSELRTAYDAPEALRESFFRNWLNPVRQETIPGVAPGQLLQVRLYTAADVEVVRQQVVIGREPMQDISLVKRRQTQ